MMIGLTNNPGKWEDSLLRECHEIIYLNPKEVSTAYFLAIVKENSEHEIMVPNIQELRLQLVQLLPSFKYLAQGHSFITFMQRDENQQLSAEAYFNELYRLALLEEQIIKQRTKDAISRAKSEGVVVGRPKMPAETILMIQNMYQYEKKTIREIATICDVSIGTAFKYAKVTN